MADLAELEDHRAPNMRDIPFSAYCKVCWEPIYVLWVVGDHEGKCMHGHKTASDCPEAMARAEFSAVIRKHLRGTDG